MSQEVWTFRSATSAKPKSTRRPFWALGIAACALVMAMLGTLLACDAAEDAHPLASGSDTRVGADELSTAIRLRTTFGLRNDEAWIRAVAEDAESEAGRLRYGTPLTAAEMSELDARTINALEIGPILERYGADHPGDWAGTYIDNQGGGVVAALFTAELSKHETAVRRLIHPEARVEFRQARWSLRPLETFRAGIDRDFETIAFAGIWYAGSGVDVRTNRVILDISSRDAGAAAEISRRLGNPEWLLVQSDGIGRWEGPRGTVVIEAVTRSGRPGTFLDCILIPDDPAAWRGNVSVGTGQTGECTLDGAGATGYTVELHALSATGTTWVTVGRTRVLVRPNEVTRVHLTVDLP